MNSFTYNTLWRYLYHVPSMEASFVSLLAPMKKRMDNFIIALLLNALYACGFFAILLYKKAIGLPSKSKTTIQLTVSNYAQCRKAYEALKATLPYLQNIHRKTANYPDKSLFWERKLYSQFYEISSLFITFHTILDKTFASIEQKNVLSSQFFTPISQKELWAERTKAYEYIL